jgi:hypothetical protein
VFLISDIAIQTVVFAVIDEKKSERRWMEALLDGEINADMVWGDGNREPKY